MRGRAIRLSPARRLLVDYTAMADDTTKGLVTRRLALAPLVKAMAEAETRPTWTAVMAKGWSLVAREIPELRRLYVKFPWPHLYELPVSVAAIVTRREVAGEPSLFLTTVKDPAGVVLAEISATIRQRQNAPVKSVREFRRALLIAALPAPVRRLAWWIGQNFARQRSNKLGTFGISVLVGEGAEIGYAVSIWTSLITYGRTEADGTLEVRCSFDHRVLDGVEVARALARLERVLNGEIVDEIATRPSLIAT